MEKIEEAIETILLHDYIAFSFSNDPTITSNDIPVIIQIFPIIGLLKSSTLLHKKDLIDKICEVVQIITAGVVIVNLIQPEVATVTRS